MAPFSYICNHQFKLNKSYIVWASASSDEKPPEKAIKTEIYECIFCGEIEYKMEANQ